MATFIQKYNARHNASLRAKTEQAILKLSTDVRNEDPGTTSHAERLACANACYTNKTYLSEMLEAFMYDVGANDTIAGDPDSALDGDIEFVVSGAYTVQALAHPPA